MKSGYKLNSLVLAATLAIGIQAQAQVSDSTGLPGDNFSLEAALELFKTSSSPEEFEKAINSENKNVNNLDLNEDGEIDYIRVIEKQDGDAHAFVLQDVVSGSESQDIAVIELEKNGNDNAVAQIVGDEDIYGEQTIVEPVEQAAPATAKSNVIVNVWAWPMVRYVYRPAYTVWVSPWGFTARPVWWRPWRPVRHHVFYAYRAPYRPRYAVVHTHRVVHAHRVYVPARTTSVTVTTRNRTNVTHYRTTRNVKSTTVHGRGGREVRATRKTTTVTGPRGNSATKTTTRVKRRRR